MALPISLTPKKIVLASCIMFLAIGSTIFLWFSMQDSVLPEPVRPCSISISWHGIQAGKSSRRDVVRILGQPQESGIARFGNQYYPFYAYEIEEGTISNFAKDRVFFRPDGVVNWIEVIVGDRDGTYHSLSEVTDSLGNTLDTIYSNNNYDPLNNYQLDVLGGPDQLYIWSECGLALYALPYCSLSETGVTKCSSNIPTVDENMVLTNTFNLRYPKPYHVGGEPAPNMTNIVLMKFLFPPTTYEAFTEHYMHKIPFGLWDEYIKGLDWEP